MATCIHAGHNIPVVGNTVAATTNRNNSAVAVVSKNGCYGPTCTNTSTPNLTVC